MWFQWKINLILCRFLFVCLFRYCLFACWFLLSLSKQTPMHWNNINMLCVCFCFFFLFFIFAIVLLMLFFAFVFVLLPLKLKFMHYTHRLFSVVPFSVLQQLRTLDSNRCSCHFESSFSFLFCLPIIIIQLQFAL